MKKGWVVVYENMEGIRSFLSYDNLTFVSGWMNAKLFSYLRDAQQYCYYPEHIERWDQDDRGFHIGRIIKR